MRPPKYLLPGTDCTIAVELDNQCKDGCAMKGF